jgi:flagellar biosynthesis protein FliQ
MARLQRVSIISLAKIFCGLHAVVGLILGLIVTIGAATTQQDDGIWSLGPWSLLVFPIVNAGLGFLTGSFLAWTYNLFSRWFGGIEFEIE